MMPSRYEPPTTVNRRVISARPRARLFTAGRVEPDPDTVIEEEIAAESVIEGPPRSLVLTVGPQLAAAYGKRAPQPMRYWVLSGILGADRVAAQRSPADHRPQRRPMETENAARGHR